MRPHVLPVFVLACGLALAAPAARAAPSSGVPRAAPAPSATSWNAPQRPFRIHGPTWYVGPHGLSSILLDTGHGLALFDGGLPASAPLIEAHVRALGFRMRDVKWILNSHAHVDHAGGIAALQRASGAQVLASAPGARALARGGIDPDDPQYGLSPAYAPVQAVTVGDGETLSLGNVAVTAHYTPGHTPGSTTWTWDSCSGGQCLHVVYADSLTALEGDGFRYADHPRRVEAFGQAIAAVAALPCDILLTPHPDASGFWDKVARRRSDDDSRPLVDTSACRTYAATAARNLQATLERDAARPVAADAATGR